MSVDEGEVLHAPKVCTEHGIPRVRARRVILVRSPTGERGADDLLHRKAKGRPTAAEMLLSSRSRYVLTISKESAERAINAT